MRSLLLGQEGSSICGSPLFKEGWRVSDGVVWGKTW